MKLVKKIFFIFLFLGFFNIVFGNSPTAELLEGFDILYSDDNLYAVLIFIIFLSLNYVLFYVALTRTTEGDKPKFGEKNSKVISALLSLCSTVTIFFVLNKVSSDQIYNVLAANIFTTIILLLTAWGIYRIIGLSQIKERWSSYLGTPFGQKRKKASIFTVIFMVLVLIIISIRSSSAVAYEILKVKESEPNGYMYDFLTWDLFNGIGSLFALLFLLAILYFLSKKFVELRGQGGDSCLNGESSSSSNTNNSSDSGESTTPAENYTKEQSEKALNIFSNILRDFSEDIEK